MNKRGILLSVGITILAIGFFCIALTNLLPTSHIFSNQEDVSSQNEKEFTFVEGVDCIPDISSYEVGTLLDIIDGDSIRVAIQGSIFEVRYIGIDTPEYNSDKRQAAVEAAEENKKILSTSLVYLFKDQSETDKYGRLLRYVIANDKFINLELVRSGHAQVKKYYPDTSCQLTFDQIIVR